MFDINQLIQDSLLQLALLALFVVILVWIDVKISKQLMGIWETMWNLFTTSLILLAGALSAFSASPYSPSVNLSNSGQPFSTVVDIGASAIPSNAIPAEAIPSNAIPAEAIPSNAIPSNAIPAEAIPSNALPAEAIPAEAIPSNAIPSNAIPSNIAAGNVKLQRLPDFGEIVCKGKCDENTKYTYYSDQAGEELAGASGPITVEVWADEHQLQKGECTTIHWEVTNADQVWFDGGETASLGEFRVCPYESEMFMVDAANLGGFRKGSGVYIEILKEEVVVEEDEADSAGEELASANRCDLFSDKDMSLVYLDWKLGGALQFYVKMSGGVPGLENDIPGDTDEWVYRARIGSFSSGECNFYKEYAGRLYCTVGLPKEYSLTAQPLTLSVNQCDTPINQTLQTALLPEVDEGSVSAGGGNNGGSSGGNSGGSDPGTEWGGPVSCSSGLSSTACSAAGGTYVTPFCVTSPCISPFCACP